METREALAAVAASAAALAASLGADTAPAGPLGADQLEGPDPASGADPLRAVADACLDGLAAVARLEARTAALKARLTAGYARAAEALAAPAASAQERTAQEMSVVAEVACVLSISDRAAGALLSESLALTGPLPLTLGALQAGTISWQHARILVDETTGLAPAAAAALEAHFLDPAAPDPARGCPAGDLAPARFRAKVRTWRERHHPVSIEKRHTKSAADRRVEFSPDRDGMAWLSAYLPADTAAGIWERTTTAARTLQGPAESRTLPQLRADVTSTWLLTTGTNDTNTDTANSAGSCGTGNSAGNSGTGNSAGSCGVGNSGTGNSAGNSGGSCGAGNSGTSNSAGNSAGTVGGPGGSGALGGSGGSGGGVPSPRAQVLVTVPVLSLLGLTEEPATLDGYGPIPPSMARRLLTEGADSFHRVLTDPRDGAPLEIGRTSYRLTKPQRQWLRLRDSTCTFPNCTNPSLDNDADHILAWAAGGTTGITNLGQLCRKHHHPQTRHRLDTVPSQQRPAPGMDLTLRPALPQRTPGLGTTPLAKPHHGHRHACRLLPTPGPTTRPRIRASP